MVKCIEQGILEDGHLIGKVQCLGRCDHQIKLRGLRIELGEIEDKLLKIPDVTACVVNKIELDGKEALCGYYVATRRTFRHRGKRVFEKIFTSLHGSKSYN